MLHRVVKNRAWEVLFRGGDSFTAANDVISAVVLQVGQEDGSWLNIFVPVWHNGKIALQANGAATFFYHFGYTSEPRRPLS